MTEETSHGIVRTTGKHAGAHTHTHTHTHTHELGKAVLS